MWVVPLLIFLGFAGIVTILLWLRKTDFNGNNMQLIAIGLANGHPFAYLLVFMILYPPVVVIIFAIIDKFKKH